MKPSSFLLDTSSLGSFAVSRRPLYGHSLIENYARDSRDKSNAFRSSLPIVSFEGNKIFAWPIRRPFNVPIEFHDATISNPFRPTISTISIVFSRVCENRLLKAEMSKSSEARSFYRVTHLPVGQSCYERRRRRERRGGGESFLEIEEIDFWQVGTRARTTYGDDNAVCTAVARRAISS